MDENIQAAVRSYLHEYRCRTSATMRSHSRLGTGQVVQDPRASTILTNSGIEPVPRPAELRGIEQDVRVYALL